MKFILKELIEKINRKLFKTFCEKVYFIDANKFNCIFLNIVSKKLKTVYKK